MCDRPAISVILPFLNEAESLPLLCVELSSVLERVGRSYELILVDDGSTDGSLDRAKRIAAEDTHVKVVALRGNYGKSAALAAGFDLCTGDVVFTLDADLQDDPNEIPNFLAKLNQGFDLVCGRRRARFDPWHKVYPSRVFNLMVRVLIGVPLHDVNCGFQCFRRIVVEEIRDLLYGELHRFLPVLAHWRRFKVAEIEIKHRPRRHGVSKYGASRMVRGFMDLTTVTFLLRYRSSPLHLFGKLGLAFGTIGFLVCLYLTTLWFLGERPIGNRPLLILGVLLLVVGVQFWASGLIAELQVHSARPGERPYIISEVWKRSDTDMTDLAN